MSLHSAGTGLKISGIRIKKKTLVKGNPGLLSVPKTYDRDLSD